MVWVSNHSPSTITVSITAKTGGSASNYTIHPAIALGPGGEPVTSPGSPESWGSNHWSRSGDETLHATYLLSGKEVKFDIHKDDHVTFYTDAYEVYTSKTVSI